MFDGTIKELIGIMKKTMTVVGKMIWLIFKTVLFWIFALAPLIIAIALVPATDKYAFVSIIIIMLICLEIPWGKAVRNLVDIQK